MRGIDVNKERKDIVDARCAYRDWGKLKRIATNILTVLKIIPIADPRCVFGIENFSRKLIRRKALDSFIVDPRSWTLFGIIKLRLF
jgi:hypothetical protein